MVGGAPGSEREDAPEGRTTLPSPALGHAQLVARVDAALAGQGIALTGNWFGGLSIEACAARARSEWERVAAGTPA